MEGWMRPMLIFGTVFVLIVLNALEFRSKRRADSVEMEQFQAKDGPEFWSARKRHEALRHIEQVLHIVNTVLIAILIAILMA